jgi:hypothetical protein
MKKFHIILIVLFGFFMMPNTTLRVEIQIVALALWKCLLRRTRKIVVKRTLILKQKSTTIAMENVEGLVQCPICKYSNTSLQSI